MKRFLVLILAISALATSAVSAESGQRSKSLRGAGPVTHQGVGLRYRITASKPRLNRRLMGPVRRWVGPVPAEPVDSFCWSGEGSVPIEGRMTIDVQPMRNRGEIVAEWTDANGSWTWTQKRFLHPDHHSSGVRIGSSVFQVDTLINEPIAHNVYLHGDTAAGQPVLPTVFTYLAAWGPGAATLNGEPFDNEFEIPAPMWLGHVMVTEGARRADGSVRTLSGEIYDPSRGGEGAVEAGDIEAHLTFHDDAFPMTSSVPPLFSFFYHLVFEDVRIEIIQADGP
ncbi:MAG: hypothetical protein DRJ50_06880 [Actinobacteria bacterium]|nr:MAG: hypothetical protein DRJ50_06880 [Actinomycetota bacterium]